MGIENNTREIEVQNQELQRANREQIEQANQEHEELGKVLDGLDTLDNEAELDEISGNEDISEQDDVASQLDNNDKIEDETSEQLETINNPAYNEVENNGFSINDVNQAVDAKEAYEAEIRDMSQDEYHDQKELDQRVEENGSEPNMTEHSVLGDDLHQEEVSNEETDNRSRLNEPERNAVDMEGSTEEASGNEEMDDSLLDVSTVDESNVQEVKLSELPDNVQESYRKYESDAENPDEGTESENPDDNTESENPDENIETENPESLSNKLDNIKDKAYEGRDSEGNMTPEAKEKLVDDMKQAYDDTPREERGDTLVPEKSEYLKDLPIAENKATGERYDDVNYDWPGNGGFEGKPEEVNPQVGDKFDRLGAENGRYVAPLDGDTPQPIESRGLPYHFTEDNIADEPSHHSYEVDRDFGQLQDAINEYNNPELTAEENDFMRGEFQKEYDRNNWPAEEYTHEPGKTYYGDIAEAFGSGGGTQLELPMSVESLKELGMIHEI